MKKNKLIIASAWSWKTTYLVEEALKIIDRNVLITTYTEANEEEIRKKIINKKWYIPKNITIQTWFSFLLQHWVRPYQSVINDKLFDRKIWFLLIEWVSAQYVSETKNFIWHYFKDFKIYSDKISKFVIKNNENAKWEVIFRISRIFPNIFIDEVQDLAGYDLDVLKLLFNSNSKVILVWDPRQWTYSTNNSNKNSKFKKAEIINFFELKELKSLIDIDDDLLTINYRCTKEICDFSNKIFSEKKSTTSWNSEKINHTWVFLVKTSDIEKYCNKYNKVTVLKERGAFLPEWNFWMTKWLTFDRVLIHPTKNIVSWIKDNNTELANTTRAKFYVAITRAKYSVAIVYDYNEDEEIEGIEKWKDT